MPHTASPPATAIDTPLLTSPHLSLLLLLLLLLLLVVVSGQVYCTHSQRARPWIDTQALKSFVPDPMRTVIEQVTTLFRPLSILI